MLNCDPLNLSAPVTGHGAGSDAGRSLFVADVERVFAAQNDGRPTYSGPPRCRVGHRSFGETRLAKFAEVSIVVDLFGDRAADCLQLRNRADGIELAQALSVAGGHGPKGGKRLVRQIRVVAHVGKEIPPGWAKAVKPTAELAVDDFAGAGSG